MASLKERYEAAMVLSGVGDALGYKDGEWEFCHYGEDIHDELRELGGVDRITVNPEQWMVSDDTVMHLATADALVNEAANVDRESMYNKLAYEYKECCLNDMGGRAPGPTTMRSCFSLRPYETGGYRIPFNRLGGGCGAAMRSMCIGLRYPKPEELDDLIAVSVEAGRMTHNHPTGYLGSLASALFTSYAVQNISLRQWGAGLMRTLPKALAYVVNSNLDVEKNVEAWGYFTQKWTTYLEEREISNGDSDPVFPEEYGIEERDVFYKSCAFRCLGGSSGHDAPMIAYDALLSSGGDWRELCSRAMFHGGDSDSTGIIAACCYGAMFGFQGVEKCNYENLEYRDRLVDNALKLFARTQGNCPTSSEETVSAENQDYQQGDDTDGKCTTVPSDSEAGHLNTGIETTV